jgi:hypothetical protein
LYLTVKPERVLVPGGFYERIKTPIAQRFLPLHTARLRAAIAIGQDGAVRAWETENKTLSQVDVCGAFANGTNRRRPPERAGLDHGVWFSITRAARRPPLAPPPPRQHRHAFRFPPPPVHPPHRHTFPSLCCLATVMAHRMARVTAQAHDGSLPPRAAVARAQCARARARARAQMRMQARASAHTSVLAHTHTHTRCARARAACAACPRASGATRP